MRSLLFCNEMLGLGHLRLSLALADALVREDEHATALVVTGSPGFAGIRLPARVDILKLPSPPVGSDSQWSATALTARGGLDLNEADSASLRGALSLTAVEQFDPEVVVVDYRPLGRHEDLRPALQWLRRRGNSAIALGLWEIDDAVQGVRRVWTPRVLAMVSDLYDLALVYGNPPEDDPRVQMLQRAGVPVHVTDLVATQPQAGQSGEARGDYLLVSAGGGVDGFPLLESVLEAVRLRSLGLPVVMVCGPMMGTAEVARLRVLAEGLDVRVEESCADMISVLAGARAVVSMAGYCSVAEVLASGKPSLLVPRAFPREEQLARARRLAAAGRIQMVEPAQLTPHRLRSQLDELLQREPSPRRAPTGAVEAARILAHARAQMQLMLGDAQAELAPDGGRPNSL